MSPDQKNLVQQTWHHVVPIADSAAVLFYDRMFEIDPDLRVLFNGTDLARQRQKLIQALSAVVGGLDHIEDLLPEIEALGRRHVDYGATDAHYETVGAALLGTLEEGLGDAWTADVEAAWTAAYALIAGVMRTAAEQSGVARPGS